MGVRQKGEVAFSAVGSNFILAYDFNALCELEDALGMSVAELETAMQSPRMTMVRTVFRIGLGRHHAVDDTTAGRIIGDVGLQRAAALIGQAFSAAFPKVEGDGDPSARPPVSA